MSRPSRSTAARTRRAVLFTCAPLAAGLLALTLTAPAAARRAAASPLPRVTTGPVSHVRGASVLLKGAVNPEGQETTYYFQFGPTVAYGSQTPTASAGNGTTAIKVGQLAAPVLAGYHYRLVATNASGTKLGRDRTYKLKSSKLKFELFKPAEPPPLGSSIVVSGVLTGIGNANHRIVLQQSAYPYLEPFTQVGVPTVTGPTGRFSFKVGVLTLSTQFRVMTLDPLPLLSPVLTERIAVRVRLKVRPSGRRGFVRLYGTVTPAEVGATTEFQLLRAARPGNTPRTEERTSRWRREFSTVVKRATRSFSRFSAIVKVRHAGLYRAYVVVRRGPLVSGVSRPLPLHAIPPKKRK